MEMAPIRDARFPNLHHIFHNAKKNLPGMSWIKSLISADPMVLPPAGVDPHRPSTVLVTPDKLHISLSQFNLINTANSVGSVAGIVDSDIVLSTLPIHFAAGQVLGLVMALVRRSQLAIASDVFEAQAVLDNISRQACTTLVAFPHEWEAISQLPSFASAPLAALKKGIIVSSPAFPAPPSLSEKIKQRFELETVVTTFGTDETSGAFLANGKPLPNVEVKIVDTSFTPLPVGARGHILVKGVNVMKGYSNSAERTRAVLSTDRWLKVGVLGSVDSSGAVQL